MAATSSTKQNWTDPTENQSFRPGYGFLLTLHWIKIHPKFTGAIETLIESNDEIIMGKSAKLSSRRKAVTTLILTLLIKNSTGVIFQEVIFFGLLFLMRKIPKILSVA